MNRKKIGVIGAMEEEMRILQSRMEKESAETVAGMEFYTGKIGGTDVVLVQSGIGKVNAAICTQILIDRFQVTHIMNTGIAGSLNERIDIGDVVVSTDAVYHDVDATVFGYEPGEVPRMGCLSFAADADFRSRIKEAVLERVPEVRLFEGRIASGDQFVSSDSRKRRIKRKFSAMCCEMEGAAIAHTAAVNGIPFVLIRFISDKADSSTAESYEQFEAEAAEHSSRITAGVLEHLGRE